MILEQRISDFINKAQTKVRSLSASLVDEFDPEGYQSKKSKDLLLKLYETRNFLNLLHSTDRGGLTDNQLEDLIDFFWKWLELVKVNQVNYNTYQMPIVMENITVPSGFYSLQEDLQQEIEDREEAIQNLIIRIDALEASIPVAADLFPDGFFDNQNVSNAVVFDDDARLHTHSNKTQLDLISADDITRLGQLAAHYASTGETTGVHVSSADRTNWNGKVTSAQLTSGLETKANTSHTHVISDVTGLEAVIAAINSDIAAMAGSDGREVELQKNGNNIEWRYVGDAVWIDLGDFKGDPGVEGDPFDIDVKGLSNDRLNSTWDGEDENFSFLELDTGFIYFRLPTGGTADVPAGWTTGLKFVGDDGWSPVHAGVDVSSDKVIFEIVDWTGGEGEKPSYGAGRWYIGPNGPTQNQGQAVNVRGPRGAGFGPLIGAVGAIGARTTHDTKPTGFIYLRNDVSPQTIFIKNSDASADWSIELPWQGPQGTIGLTGPPVTLGTAGEIPFINTGATDFAYSGVTLLWSETRRTLSVGDDINYSGSALTPAGGGYSAVIGQDINLSGDYSWSAIIGDVHNISVSFNNNQLSGTGFTASGGSISNSLINSNGIVYSGAGSKGGDLVTGTSHAYNTTGGSGNNVITGSLHSITGASITGISLSGSRGSASAANVLIHAYPILNQATRPIIASGLNAVNISANSSSQVLNDGALADYCVIIGGQDGSVPADSPGAVILSGNAIKARATTPNEVYATGLTLVAGALTIINVAAPAVIADTFRMYATDIVAGNSAPHFKTENGDIVKLYKQAALTATVATDLSTELASFPDTLAVINNLRTRQGEIETILTNLGFI